MAPPLAPRKKSSSATPGRQSCSSSATPTGTKSSKLGSSQHTTGTYNDTICPDCQIIIVVDDQSKAIECEVCDRWYHTSCQNISDALYMMCFKISEETTNVSWFCKCCNQGAKRIMTKIHKLNERQERAENGLLMLMELHQDLKSI